jgi:hypothetical protein
VVVFGLMGQSNADGTNCRYREVRGLGLPIAPRIPGCYIFDKVARKLRLQVDLAAQVRGLTPGFANGALTPWLDPSNDYFGPEIGLAHEYEKQTGHTVVIVKLAIGGSRVERGDFLNWNVRSSPKVGLLNVFHQGYWTPTMQWLLHKAKNVRIGGMISMVGGSDARTKKAATEYSAHMSSIIGATRDFVQPNQPNRVPWLVVKTPLITRDGIPIGFLKEVRSSQDQLAILPNVKVQEVLQPDFHPGDPIHLNEKGQVLLGHQMAQWALAQGNDV